MKHVAVLVVVATISLCGCRATSAPPSPGASHASTVATATPDPGGIDSAVEEFVARAQQNDVAYFTRLRGCETTESARYWIDSVNKRNVLKYYRSLLETETTTNARLNFHSRGFFLVGLEKQDGVWRVTDIGH